MITSKHVTIIIFIFYDVYFIFYVEQFFVLLYVIKISFLNECLRDLFMQIHQPDII